jgi:hypothetical protein
MYTGVVNILMFSSMVGYLDGGIYCEGGMSPVFLNIGNSFNCFLYMMQRRPFPATRTAPILVCRKTCGTITVYRYTCTYNMLYSLSYVREKCDDGL